MKLVKILNLTLILLGLLLIFGLIFFIYIETPTPLSKNLTPDINISTWKIYKDKEYKFALRYPPNFTVKQPYGKGDIRIMKNLETYYLITISELSGYIMVKEKPTPISALSLKDQLVLQLKQRCPHSSPESVIWRSIDIGGIRGLQASYSDDECIKQYLPWGIVIKNNFCYSIQLIKGSKNEYNQILSTFEFIEKEGSVNESK